MFPFEGKTGVFIEISSYLSMIWNEAALFEGS